MGFLDFFTGSSIWVYVFIFFGKIIEVSVSTIRLVLIARGERLAGSVVAFFEILLWLSITGTVLINFQKDLVKVGVLALAFAIGNYIGSWLESKLAFGLCTIQIILPEHENARELADCLRREHFGVTVLDGHGKDGARNLLMVNSRRKRASEAMKIVTDNTNGAFVTISDLKIARGGYWRKKQRDKDV